MAQNRHRAAFDSIDAHKVPIMEWLANLLNKMPTLKRITSFFYVAANWNSISRDFEQYRQQIVDRENWMKAREENLKTIHEQETQALTSQYEQQLQKGMGYLAELYSDAVVRLAIFYRFNPILFDADRNTMDPFLFHQIQKILPQISLPPPPPQLRTLKNALLAADALERNKHRTRQA